MMPINFEGSNRTYTKPEGWTDEQCSDLHVFEVKAHESRDGNPYITCVMQPNKEDIEAIVAGRPIAIRLIAHQMCPITVWTWDEEGNPNT